MSRLTKGYVTAFIGIAAWSTTGVLISYLLTSYEISPLLLAFWRNLLVCLALVLVFLTFQRSAFRIQVPEVRFYIIYGLVLAFMNCVWVFSVAANGAAVSTVLIYSSVGFTVILARWLFKERLALAKILAVVASLGGCVMVSNAYRTEMWSLNSVGISTGLLSGLAFAGYSLVGKEAARRETSPWASLLYSFAFGSLFVLVVNLLPGVSGAAGSPSLLVPHLPIEGWLILIVLAFIPTLLGFGLYNLSMHYLPAGTANLLATSEPVMTAVEAYIFLGERMTVIQIMGSLIVLSAMLVVQGQEN
jgi:DME family drug/metabolite transporter